MDTKSPLDVYRDWLGIADPERPLTNYQLLGLTQFSDRGDEIERRAQEQLDKLRQFTKGEHSLQAKRLAFEIESAKACLLNPAAKAAYDAALRSRGRSDDRPRPAPAATSPQAAATRSVPSASPLHVSRPAVASPTPLRGVVAEHGIEPAVCPPEPTFDPYYKWLAIPPSEQPPNYYRLLGVSLFESDFEAIANAADARLGHVRTFQGSRAETCQRLLNEIAEAKACLLNVTRKSNYDRQLRETLEKVKQPAMPPDFELAAIDVAPPAMPSPIDTARKTPAAATRKRGKKRPPAARWVALVSGVAAAICALAAVYVSTHTEQNATARREQSAGPGDREHRKLSETKRPNKKPLVTKSKKPRVASRRPLAGWTPPAAPKPKEEGATTSRPANPAISEPEGESRDQGVPTPVDRPPPRRPVASHSEPRPDDTPRATAALRDVNLSLPSGARLTEAQLLVPGDWRQALFSDRRAVHNAEYPNKSIRGLVTLSDSAKSKGKVHGWVAALHENGRLQTLSHYREGELDGVRQHWNEDGKRLFYAEYKRGRKDGVLCLFRQGMPWRIEEWTSREQKKPVTEYLVMRISEGVRLVPRSEWNNDDLAQMEKEKRESMAVVAQLVAIEVQLKGEIKKRYAAALERQRREEVTKQSADRLRRQLERSRQHALEREAGFIEMRRRINSPGR
ncbi:MAG: hypothetical protein ABFC96_05460 [Thermoguttaceae bacterium]